MEETKFGYTLTIPTLRQKHVEQFVRDLAELSPDGTHPIVRNGNVARVGARMGWIVKTSKDDDADDGVPIGNVEEERVGDLPAYVVQWMAGKISEAYGAAFDIPGE
jgi:hypothetical protein